MKPSGPRPEGKTPPEAGGAARVYHGDGVPWGLGLYAHTRRQNVTSLVSPRLLFLPKRRTD